MIKDIFQKVLANALSALYQPFWLALLLATMFMFVWKQYKSAKAAVIYWIAWFRAEKRFRIMFFLAFYTAMILFRTLLNRVIWLNPISNVIGVWGLHTKNSTGEVVFTTEVIENLALFIPFTVLLLCVYHDKIVKPEMKIGRVLWESTKIVYIFSFTIEMLQLFLRLGTWQLSDLFYNTLGGFIGGLIYWIGWKFSKRKK